MASLSSVERPHAVLLTIPGQGHINPMLQLAKLLHSKGFYITFVDTEFSHQNILDAEGPGALRGLEDFRHEAIPDGVVLPASRSGQKVSPWCLSSFDASCTAPFREVLVRLLDGPPGVPRVTCVVYNWLMGFALGVARELRVPALVFCTMNAVGFMCSLQLEELVRRGYAPLKDESYLTNGYLDTTVDWIPGMEGIRLRDLSSFIRTTDADDFFLREDIRNTKTCLGAQGLILNTFDELEPELLDALTRDVSLPKVYTIGPLSSALAAANGGPTDSSPCTSMRFNYWKQDDGCMEWLDARSAGSVIYVSFGSLATLTAEELAAFAWGLADSNHPFLWVVRPDLVAGGGGEDRGARLLTEDFVRETEGRSFIAGWCPQGRVLSHPSVGGFLTHCGWNSMLESICGGVPMICWPGFAEQYANCRYAREEWGIGMELEEAKRECVSRLVKELMEGEGGKELRKNAAKWKARAERATLRDGSSRENLEKLAKDLSSGTFC